MQSSLLLLGCPVSNDVVRILNECATHVSTALISHSNCDGKSIGVIHDPIAVCDGSISVSGVISTFHTKVDNFMARLAVAVVQECCSYLRILTVCSDNCMYLGSDSIVGRTACIMDLVTFVQYRELYTCQLIILAVYSRLFPSVAIPSTDLAAACAVSNNRDRICGYILGSQHVCLTNLTVIGQDVCIQKAGINPCPHLSQPLFVAFLHVTIHYLAGFIINIHAATNIICT